MNSKPFFPPSPSASTARRTDVSRQLTSEHIRDHLAAFEARGGQVEVLGTTPTLKRIQAAADVKAGTG